MIYRLLKFCLGFLCALVFSCCLLGVFSCASNSATASNTVTASNSVAASSNVTAAQRMNMIRIRDCVESSLRDYLNLFEEELFTEDDVTEIALALARKARNFPLDEAGGKEHIYEVLKHELEKECFLRQEAFGIFSDFTYEFFSDYL